MVLYVPHVYSLHTMIHKNRPAGSKTWMEGHTENRHTVISKTCFPPPSKTSEDSYITLAATGIDMGRSAEINVVLNYTIYREMYYLVRGTNLLVLQAHTFTVLLSHKRKLQNL